MFRLIFDFVKLIIIHIRLLTKEGMRGFLEIDTIAPIQPNYARCKMKSYTIHVILGIILLSLIVGCSIPSEFGIPTFKKTFRAVVLNDTYNLAELAEDDSTLFFDEVLYLSKNIKEEEVVGIIEIEDPEERFYDITLNEIAPDTLDLEALIGITTPIPEFNMVPNLKTLAPYNEFEEVTFSSGTIELLLINNTVIGVGNAENGNPLSLEIFDWDDNLLKSVTFTEDVLPGEELLYFIAMAGETFPNKLKTRLSGGSQGSYGVEVPIDNELLSTKLDVYVNFRDVSATEVIDAQIPPQEIDPVEDETEMDIEYPEVIGDFTFNGFSTIDFSMTSPIPGFVKVDLVAVNIGTGEEVVLAPVQNSSEYSLTFELNAGITEVNINSDDYNINPMLSILPDKFIYSIYATVGDTTATYDLSSEDILGTEIDIYAELQIETSEEGVWFIPQEESEIRIGTIETKDFGQEHYDAFESGLINMTYQNSTGLEMGVDLFMSDNKDLLISEIYNFENPDTSLVKIIHIPMLEITDGFDKMAEAILQKSDLIFFLADSVYTIPRLHVFSAGDMPLGGELSLNAEVEVELLISDDLVDDEGEE